MSQLKIVLLVNDASPNRRCRLPHADAAYAVAERACPHCAVSDSDFSGELTGFKIAGHGRRPSLDDRAWEADASCLACNAHVGVLRVETNTLFGVREDEAVLRGRCRVY